MARLTEEGVERQKLQILNSALNIFNQKGFHGTKLEEIAKASGISRSPLYYHFNDKKKLYEATLIFSLENWIDNIRRIGGREDNVFDILRDMLLESLTGQFYLSQIFLSELRINTDLYSETADIYFKHLHLVRDYMYDLLEEAKKKGQIIQEADSRVIAENLSAMNSGISDMRDYFVQGTVRIIDSSADDYTKSLVGEYISCLRFRYEKKKNSR